MYEVAVVGMDGSGKSWLIKRIRITLHEHLFTTGYLDIPRYSECGWFGRLMGRILGAVEGNKLCISAFGLTSTLGFWWFRKLAAGKDFLFFEHHPGLEIPSYAYLYFGREAFLAAKVIAKVFPKPKLLVYIDLTAQEALSRIRSRNRALQPHETPDKLRIQRRLLKLQCASSGIQILEIKATAETDFEALAATLTRMAGR